MKRALVGMAFLAGCGSMQTDSTPIRTDDGSRVYSITSLYDGEPGSREYAVKSMDMEAKNLCASGYTLIAEKARPTMDPTGGVISSRLIWEVQCDKKPEAVSP